MSTITIEAQVHAPLERCFDLARDVDLHCQTVSQTRESAIAGVTSGLLKFGDTVTWEAVHFGLRMRLTVKITEFDPPYRFVDEMTQGPFKRLKHTHEFAALDDETLMTDTFEFESPFGVLGRLLDRLLLESYMRRFLSHRLLELKRIAEADFDT